MRQSEVFKWMTLAVSIFIGPLLSSLLLRTIGPSPWLCVNEKACWYKLLFFYIVGFAAVWAVYWACVLLYNWFVPVPNDETDKQPQEDNGSDNSDVRD